MTLHSQAENVSASSITYTGPATGYIKIERSLHLEGTVELSGAKNSSLSIIASLLLTRGVSILHNVPASHDILQMIALIEHLGAHTIFDIEKNMLTVDTTHADGYDIPAGIMATFRASVLVLGPVLARHKRASIGFPGGCQIGARPIDYHIKNLEKMGAVFIYEDTQIHVHAEKLHPQRLLLEYQSMGTTKNLLMVASLTPGRSKIVNAAFEPEIFDFISVLTKMGARISYETPHTLVIDGVDSLNPITHNIMFDRLEAGGLLLAAAITGGHIHIPNAPAHALELFLMKLEEIGHHIIIGDNQEGITLKASATKQGITVKTAPHPCFPTDLQAPIMSALILCPGKSSVQETVFESRMAHIHELNKLGAKITMNNGIAHIEGVQEIIGSHVVSTDIRASCALVLAGLAAHGTTIVENIHHWKRGYEALDKKLRALGAHIEVVHPFKQ